MGGVLQVEETIWYGTFIASRILSPMIVCMAFTNIGPIMSINVFGQNVIILNDAKAASELLDKRSAIYSDRPTFPMVDSLSII